AVVADLEMQLVAVGAGAAHLGDLLARLHPLALGYQALAVVAVGRQPLFVVLDDDQLAIAHQARARIDHDAVGGRVHRLAGGAADVDTLAGGVAFDIGGDHRPLRRPLPADAAGHRRGTRARR